MKPAEDNPNGFWEHELLTRLNDDILARLGGSWHDPPSLPAGWEHLPTLADLRERARVVLHQDFGAAPVWGWKDPRTCLTLPFWRTLLPPTQYVICLRNPVDVARSLQRRNRFPFDKGVRLWLAYMDAALRHTAEQPRLFVAFEDLFDDWEFQLRRLSAFLGGPDLAGRPDIRKAVQEYIEDRLRHYRISTLDAVDEPRCAFPARALYLVLRLYVRLETEAAGARDGAYKELQEALDRFGRSSIDAVGELDNLRARGAELRSHLATIQGSLSWILLARYRGLRDRCLPQGTRRRSLYEATLNSFGAFVTGGLCGAPKRGATRE